MKQSSGRPLVYRDYIIALEDDTVYPCHQLKEI